MMNPTETLQSWLYEHNIDHRKIEASGLSTICIGMLKDNRDEYLRGMIEIVKQKQFNRVVEDEILSIQDTFDRKGLQVIFIKGLLLAEDIYEKPEIRHSGDIDILIDYNHIEESLDALSSFGYYEAADYSGIFDTNQVNDRSIEGDYYRKYIDQFGRYRLHFPAFSNGTIYLDCHLCIFQHVNNVNEKMSRCFLQSETQSFRGRNIRVLSLCQRIVHLMAHFVKDTYEDNVFWVCSGWKRASRSVKVNKLHDLALLFYKHPDLDWSGLMEEAVAFSQEAAVFTCLRFLEEVYQLSVPPEVMELLGAGSNNKKKRSFCDIVLSACGHMNVDTLLFGDQYRVVESIVPALAYKGCIREENNQQKFYIVAASNNLMFTDHTTTMVPYADYAEGTLRLEEEGIWLHIQVKDIDIHSQYFPVINIQMGDGTVIEKYSCIFPRIQFVLSLINGKITERVFVGMEEYSGDVRWSAIFDDNILEAELLLDNELLPIDCRKELYVNIEIDERDANGELLRAPTVYMKNYDLTNFAKCRVI